MSEVASELDCTKESLLVLQSLPKGTQSSAILVPAGASDKDTKNQSRVGSGGGVIKKPVAGANAQVALGHSSSKVLPGKDLVQTKKMQALDTKLGPTKAKATILKELGTTTAGGGGQSRRKSKTQAKAA